MEAVAKSRSKRVIDVIRSVACVSPNEGPAPLTPPAGSKTGCKHRHVVTNPNTGNAQMQYDLVITTYLPGRANEAARLAADAGSTNGLHGYWLSSDIGVQNRTIELWSQSRPAPQGDPPLEQSSRRFDCAVAPTAPEVSGGVYELRRYRMRGGMVSSWLDIFLTSLPARERYSRLAGLFISLPGEEDEAVHFWGYADLAARAAARAAAVQDPTWQAFLKESRSNRYVERQESIILLPASHSPLN